jgi:hypothetical protein
MLKGGQVEAVCKAATTFLMQQELLCEVQQAQQAQQQVQRAAQQVQQSAQQVQEAQQRLLQTMKQATEQLQNLQEQPQVLSLQQKVRELQQQQRELEQQLELHQQQQPKGTGAALPASVAKPAMRVIRLLQPTLLKLLAARKRARDWKNPELSSRVVCVLAALEVALSLIVRAPAARSTQEVTAVVVEDLCRAALLQQTASAQGEVAQLLHALVQQQQRGQLLEEGVQQLKQLQQLAHWLLSVWLPLRELVLWGGEFSASRELPASAVATAVFMLDAVELAAVLAQSLGPDSPPAFYDTVTKLTHRFVVLCCRMAGMHGLSVCRKISWCGHSCLDPEGIKQCSVLRSCMCHARACRLHVHARRRSWAPL